MQFDVIRPAVRDPITDAAQDLLLVPRPKIPPPQISHLDERTAAPPDEFSDATDLLRRGSTQCNASHQNALVRRNPIGPARWVD